MEDADTRHLCTHVSKYTIHDCTNTGRDNRVSKADWRRFVGQQLMLLTELMILVVPAFFADSSAIFNPSVKRKRMGATRNELHLHAAHFVNHRLK
jgi:hypothetical protein